MLSASELHLQAKPRRGWSSQQKQKQKQKVGPDGTAAGVLSRIAVPRRGFFSLTSPDAPFGPFKEVQSLQEDERRLRTMHRFGRQIISGDKLLLAYKLIRSHLQLKGTEGSPVAVEPT